MARTRTGQGAVTRRAALGAAAGLAATAGFVPLGRLAQAAAAPARRPRFFSPAELALLDELTELLIPGDASSPGARAADVAWDIDRRLADKPPRWKPHAALRARFRAGLGQVDRLCRAQHGAAFLAATPAQRVAVLERLAASERRPTSPEERFFVELKTMTATSYYTSEIGIHEEIGYKGNSYFDEFVGVEASTVPLPPIVKLGR